jgi:TP901-1 family phage major tail protein
MAAEAGRDLRIKYASDGSTYVVVAGARTDSMTFNNEAIDITDKDDAGVRTYLDDIGVKSMSLSCTGVATASTFSALAAAATSDSALHAFEIDMGSFATYTGSFFITSFEATGEQADTITFTLSLESSGAITAS